MGIPKCTPKQFVWILLLITVSGALHIWYMNYYVISFTNNITKFFTLAHSDFLDQNDIHQAVTVEKRILFWNGISIIKNQRIQCCDYGCTLEKRSNTSDTVIQNAIIFTEKILNSTDRPKSRHDYQYYIFWSLKPSNVPACEDYNDNFFNWTFTYRLDSTVVWYYFVVEDFKSRKIVAPNKSVVWEENEGPARPEVKKILKMKTKTLAWILSNNKMNQLGDRYMVVLQDQLSRLGLFIELFDPYLNKSSIKDWDNMKKKEYYFFIAIEDTIADDYVTDKILRAYNNYAVPVVLGGANYSWFLPSGSYLNAMELDPYRLANAIKQAVTNPEKYESYFYWRNVYRVEPHPAGQHPMCRLCAALNEGIDKTKNAEAIENFRDWWNTPNAEKSCYEKE